MHTYARSLTALFALLVGAAPIGCTVESSSDGSGGTDAGAAGHAGASGSGSGGNSAGAGGGGGSGARGGSGGSANCEAGLTGALDLVVEGLPPSVPASIAITGPAAKTATASKTFATLPSGVYSIESRAVTDATPVVRSLYEAAPRSVDVCVSPANAQSTVSYSAVPTSGKLWVVSSEEANLQGFAAASLGASNASPPALAMDAKAGGDIAFDRDGNVWTFGPTLAEAPLLRYPHTAFAASGPALPDRELVLADQPCTTLHAMAFAPKGSLWVSSCGVVLRYDAATLAAASGEVSADAIISNLDDNGDVAFDRAGNLWVTDAGLVKRYDLSRLAASTGAAADAVFTVRNASDTADLAASNLLFDADGDLWIVDFGGNLLSEVKASALAGVGAHSVPSSVTIALSVTALLSRPAFDDAGALWISYQRGSVARVAPEALLVSTDAGAPTTPEVILSSSTIGYASNVAFFPAPAGLPLYHSF